MTILVGRPNPTSVGLGMVSEIPFHEETIHSYVSVSVRLVGDYSLVDAHVRERGCHEYSTYWLLSTVTLIDI